MTVRHFTRSISTWNDEAGQHDLHGFVRPVTGFASYDDHSDRRSTFRAKHLDDFADDAKDFAGPCRPHPFQLRAGTDKTACDRQSLYDEASHREHCHLPATGDESAEETVGGTLFVEMEGLRIEIGGEALDRLGFDPERSALEGPTDLKILEK